MIDLKFKLIHPKAELPRQIREGDAGLDLVCTNLVFDKSKIIYHTGVCVEIPEGYCGLLIPRSSVVKTSLILANSVGLIDSNYRGELKLVYETTRDGAIYLPGERVGQLLIIKTPKLNITQVTDLSDSNRGDGGFGSSGN